MEAQQMNTKHDHRVPCLMTREQYLAILAAAIKSGLSMSAFIRQAAIKAAEQ
jgi:uncharacterized protein (DUF1778 family)